MSRDSSYLSLLRKPITIVISRIFFKKKLKFICNFKHIKKAQHPVGLFRIWVLDMTPVVSHVLMHEPIIVVLCSGTSCSCMTL